MKKSIFFTLSSLLFSISLTAQKSSRPFDPANAREGEKVEYCHQHVRMQEILNDPAMMQIYLEEQAQDILNKNKTDYSKGTVYKIPVVFHVLHNGGVENISDEQILDALFIMNRDYRRLNADADNVHSDFQGMPSDVEVEFVLATKAPNGVCFDGITRTTSALSYQGDNGNTQVQAIVSGNDVYNGQWQGNRYLNIFICGDIGGAAGYTTKPAFGGTGMTNGIWVMHDYVGSIGTSSPGTSRTLTHEAGHWLNLDHTWGGTNNPAIASNCNSDDAVQDTPNCIGVQACAINSNTCNSDDAYWGMAMRDNVENYMDYSYCSKMFTAGQVTRMRAALNSTSGGRNNLHTTSNLNLTGANGDLYLCKADFSADRTTICAGESVQFSDESYNAASGWNWSFPSGSPASSTDQNPVVSYGTPGLYAVTLTSNDGANSDGETKTAYINVLPVAASIPFVEGFESYSTLNNLNNWEIVNTNNNNKFTLETTLGHTGSKSVKLVNFGQAGGSSDELIASAVDLSGVSIVTLSFRYAYRKKTSTDVEYLKVFITNDCGEVWTQRKTISGNALSTLTSTTSWAPTSINDWTTAHMTNVTSDYLIENFRYKFKFESDGGNNLYLDNINIYEGSPSDGIVVGLTEGTDITDLALFPNPTDAEVNVRFTVAASQQVLVQIQDVSGKIVKSTIVNAIEGSNLVILDTADMAAGAYFMKLNVGGSEKNLQFVVK